MTFSMWHKGETLKSFFGDIPFLCGTLSLLQRFLFRCLSYPSWQFKRCLADLVEIHVIGRVTDLCGIRLLLIKLN